MKKNIYSIASTMDANGNLYVVDTEKGEGNFISALQGDITAPMKMAYDEASDTGYCEVKLSNDAFAIGLVNGNKCHIYKQLAGGGTQPITAGDVVNSDFQDVARELINGALLAGGIRTTSDEDIKTRIEERGGATGYLASMISKINGCKTLKEICIPPHREVATSEEPAAACAHELMSLLVDEVARRNITPDNLDPEIEIETAPPTFVSSLWAGIQAGAISTLDNPLCKAEVEGGEPLTEETGFKQLCKPWFTPSENDPALMSEDELAEAESHYGEMAKSPSKVCIAVLQAIHCIAAVGEYVNIMLLGVAGCGKTTLARILGFLMGVKVFVYQIEANADTTSIWGSFQPRLVKANKVDAEDCPYDILQAIKDPTAAWLKLGHSETEPMSKGEVLKETIAASMKWAAEQGAKAAKKNDGGMELVWVDSAVTRAFREGGILLLDEIDKAKNQEVLNVFNTVLATSGDTSYTLPNGEVIKRSPKLVVLLAGNYNRQIDTSLLSRAQEKFDLQTPKPEELARRALAQNQVNGVAITSDTKGAEKMARIISELAATAKDEDIRDGSIGERELIACVTKAAMLQALSDGVKFGEATVATISEENWIRAAVTTILNKMSQDADSRNQLLGAFTNVYSESLVRDVLDELGEFVAF